MSDNFDGGNNRPGGRRGGGRGRRTGGGARTVAVRRTAPVVREPVTLPPVMSVSELAEKIETGGIDIIRELMKIGIMANLNQQIDYATAARVAEELGWETNEQQTES